MVPGDPLHVSKGGKQPSYGAYELKQGPTLHNNDNGAVVTRVILC